MWWTALLVVDFGKGWEYHCSRGGAALREWITGALHRTRVPLHCHRRNPQSHSESCNFVHVCNCTCAWGLWFLPVYIHIMCVFPFMQSQAVIEMYEDGESEVCGLPLDFVTVVLRPGMSPELLWRVSWALNGIGHNIVELSVYDWLAAIRRQRNEMWAPPSIFCFLFFPCCAFMLCALSDTVLPRETCLLG